VTAVRRLTIIVGVIVGLAALEVNIGPLLAVIGAAGFVVAFALQNSLGNFASGILIMMFRPFDVGDAVEVAGIAGTIKAVNLLSTQMMTFDNKAVIIPNNEVWGGVITNMTATGQRRVDMVFGIGYDDDIDMAQRILEDIVANHELVLKEPEPVIRMNELGDSSVNFIVRPWAQTQDVWTVYWDITREVKKRFDKEGISIPFPQRDVHVYNTALPASSKDSAA
jgi:small conductance mechanosensitive channel